MLKVLMVLSLSSIMCSATEAIIGTLMMEEDGFMVLFLVACKTFSEMVRLLVRG
jgi:hypothetical protein